MGQLPGGISGKARQGLGLVSGTPKGAESEKRESESLVHV